MRPIEVDDIEWADRASPRLRVGDGCFESRLGRVGSVEVEVPPGEKRNYLCSCGWVVLVGGGETGPGESGPPAVRS